MTAAIEQDPSRGNRPQRRDAGVSRTGDHRPALPVPAQAAQPDPAPHPRWVDIAAFAVLGSLLLSAWLIATTDKINPDGALYIDTAKRLLSGDVAAAYQLYPWPFFSACIALISHASGMHPETSALTLNALLAGVLSLSFVGVVRSLGGDRKTLLFAALVILTFPYLNEKRAEVIRDIGYWSLYLLGLWLFLRYFRLPSWRRALPWGAVTLLAVAFRIEGLAILALLPGTLLWRSDTPPDRRLRITATAYSVPAAAAVALLVAVVLNPELVKYSGRLFEPVNWLNQLWAALSQGLDEKARLLQAEVFRPTLGAYARHTADGAYSFLLAGIAGIVLFKLVSTLTPLYSGLLLIPRFRRRLVLDSAARCTLAGLIAINLAILLVYVVQTYFLSSRFAFALALTLLLPVPFALASLHDHWLRGRGARRGRRWAYPLYAAALLVMALSGLITTSPSKQYVMDAGHWIRDNLPGDARLLTNVILVDYYSERGVAWEARARYRLPPPSPLGSYDFAAIEKRSGRFPAGWQAIAAEQSVRPVASFDNSRNDGITIFQILQRTP